MQSISSVRAVAGCKTGPAKGVRAVPVVELQRGAPGGCVRVLPVGTAEPNPGERAEGCPRCTAENETGQGKSLPGFVLP